MNPLVRQLFDELVDLTPTEREKVFAEYGVMPDVRAEVDSLLEFHSPDGQTFSDCIAEAAGKVLRAEDGSEPDHCGPYRLVRPLGSGGMGAVYLAERSDGEIEQKVAIKLLGLGANRQVWRERFLKERQLLASLNHPSIVHVIDAGHTNDGLPYLAMEYVEGIPIDTYAAQIEWRERLKLFLDVCEGIAHAHRHLIIHRDLKPSNILVDSSGRPKLLDFGIAKLLDETGDRTQTFERLLTANYASPEQLRGAIQTTATDIYSLAAVLYKLMTGQSPHEIDVGRAPDIDVIAGERPVTPCTRLNPSLPTDLDYILRKALRTEPEERYISVDAFASDIRALLDGRPVRARSGNAGYRLHKFLRRYWVPMLAAALVIVSLVAGLYVANRERAIAQRRFQDVRQLANKLFDIDAEVSLSPGTTKARQLIVGTSLDYLQRLRTDVRGDPGLALEVANAYMRVARVEGVPITNNLGQMERAEETLKTAEGLIESVLAAEPGNRTAMLRSAQIAHDRMILAWWLRRPRGQSLLFARKSAEWLDKYRSTGHVDRREANAIFACYSNVARQLMRQGESNDALRVCGRGLELARFLNVPPRAGELLEVMADIRCQQGDIDEALTASKQSVQLTEPAGEALDAPQTMNFILALIREGKILDDDNGVSLGRPEEAASVFKRAFKIAGDLARQDPNDFNSAERFAGVGVLLAGVQRHRDPHRALELYDTASRRMTEMKNSSKARRTEVEALTGSTYCLLQLGRYAEARQRLDAAFVRLSQFKLYAAEQIQLGSEADDSLRSLAEYQAATREVAGAIETYQKLLALVFAAKPNPEADLGDAVDLSNIYRGMARLYRRAKQAEPASRLEARRLELWQLWDRKLPNNAFVRGQLETAGVQ